MLLRMVDKQVFLLIEKHVNNKLINLVELFLKVEEDRYLFNFKIKYKNVNTVFFATNSQMTIYMN